MSATRVIFGECNYLDDDDVPRTAERTMHTTATGHTETPIETAVFHICSRAALADARRVGVYRAESLDREGFVHLSRSQQVLPTARAYFADVPDLVLLVIDPTLLSAPLVYEAPAPLRTSDATDAPIDVTRASELFPHCYGPINLDAISDVIDLARFTGHAIHT